MLALVPASASAKERNWETGKLIDAQQGEALTGMSSNAAQVAGGIYDANRGDQNPGPKSYLRVYETFYIEGGSHVYVALQRQRFLWSKPAGVKLNADVKYAVQEHKGKEELLVLDESGKKPKARKMMVVKDVPRTGAKASN
jgi:hypothetical protein